MEHVIVRRDPDQGGYWVDPRPHLAVLPDIAEQLPPGARALAQDPKARCWAEALVHGADHGRR